MTPHDTMAVIEYAVGTIDRSIAETSMTESDMVDIIGTLDAAIRRLRDMRNGLMTETPAGVAGAAWRTVEARSAKRSYSDTAILSTLMDRHGGMIDALHAALASGALRLSWQWSGLRKLFAADDLPLVVVPHEIGDGDEPHVGEMWETSVRVEPVVVAS